MAAGCRCRQLVRTPTDPSEETRGGARPRESLSTHLDRVVARLVARRSGANAALDVALDDIVRELDAARAGSKQLRGDRREAMLRAAPRAGSPAGGRGTCRLRHRNAAPLTTEAEEQLSPFRQRMPVEAYAQSQQACIDRLLREHARLPTIAFD